MMVRNLVAGSALILAAGSVLAVPSELADLGDANGNQLLDQVPATTFLAADSGYANLADTKGYKPYSDASMNATGDHAGLYDTVGTSGEGMFGADVVDASEGSADSERNFNDMVVGFTDAVAVAVPEPGTLALLGMGLLGLGVARARKTTS